MTDISMCRSTTCKASDTCRRHADSGTKPEPRWQTYADFEPDSKGMCDAYWHVNQMTSAYHHYDCWRDGGCEPPGLKPYDYQGDPMDPASHPASHPASEAPLEGPIRAMCQRMADFLVEKNRAYGNSVGDPCGIFARRADPLLQMDVRIDDKINRLRKGSEYPGEDTVWDLAGYLVLRQIVAEQQKQDGAK